MAAVTHTRQTPEDVGESHTSGSGGCISVGHGRKSPQCHFPAPGCCLPGRQTRNTGAIPGIPRPGEARTVTT